MMHNYSYLPLTQINRLSMKDRVWRRDGTEMDYNEHHFFRIVLA